MQTIAKFEKKKRDLIELLEEFASIPPDQVGEKAYAARQRIAREFATPGLYICPTGEVAYCHGPTQMCEIGKPEDLFALRFRYQSGEKKGEIFTVPFFGEEGFFEPILTKEGPRPRYAVQQDQKTATA